MLLAEVGISVLIICKFSNKWTCTRKKEVEGLSCGFEDNEGFKRKPPMYYTEVNDLSYTIAIPQPTLTERLDARTCELCGKVGPVVMRHVRKLNQLKGKTECDRLMLEKHRKTLVVCEKCYAKIHSHAK